MVELGRGEQSTPKETDPQATTLWIMRHGPTEWNLARRIQGNVDTDLAPEALMPYFEKIQVHTLPQPDRIIVSGFKRNQKTAEGLITYLSWPEIKIVTKPELKERKWGIFEGKVHNEVLAELLKDPELITKYPDMETMENLSPVIDAPGFRVEGSESMDDVEARVKPALLKLRDEFPGENLLLISHAGVMLSQGFDHRVVNQVDVIKDVSGGNTLVKIFPQ